MTDEFDYSAFVEKHRAAMSERFQNPAYDRFVQSFGMDVPIPLRRLYDQGSVLMNTPVSVGIGSAGVDIQSITPITDATIAASQRYGWKFFEFATGSSNESLLFAMDGSDLVYVDHDGNAGDVEATAIKFTSLLLKLEMLLNRPLEDCE